MEALMALGTVFFVVMAAVVIFMIVSMWIVYEKANQPGWAAIIPIYNILILLKIAGKPWWWIFGILLGIIPFLGAILVLVWSFLVYNSISKSFGKDVGFTIGLVLLGFVFWPILAFSDAKYEPIEEGVAPAAEAAQAESAE